MSDELAGLSATRLAALVRAREVSPVEIVGAYLNRIERVNPMLNAVVTLAPDALERAREAETAVMLGDDTGLLHGVPITVKDTIETAGLRTTSGSLLRANHVPTEDATAVARLKASGAILLGKTNVPEMAIPYECDNPVFGRTNNPHDRTRTCGGSSGGEAAAISACLSAAGLGSDLSGSIRVPAHFCGIAGLKPTAGRVSSEGHFPVVEGAFSTGAVLGPMARKVEDLSLLLKVLTVSKTAEHSSKRDDEKLKGWRVASFITEESVTVETRQAVRAALLALESAGLSVTDEQPPGFERAIDLWPALFLPASTVQLREFYAGNEERAGKLVSAILNASVQPFSAEQFADASLARDSLRETLLQWMSMTPLIVAPVGATPAFEHGARRVEVEGKLMSTFRAFGYSRAANVLGLPSVSIPAGRSPEGLPIGVQIIGRPFEDEAVLSAAAIIEQSLGAEIAECGFRI